IVPSQPVGSGVYVDSLGNIKAVNGDPLLNDAGQAAGVAGLPFFRSFFEQPTGSPSLVVAGNHAAEFVAGPVTATSSAMPAPSVSLHVPQSKPNVVSVRSRPTQGAAQPSKQASHARPRSPHHPSGPRLHTA